MAALTEGQFYVLRAKLGGLAKAARHNPDELTRSARDGRWARYLSLADPDGSLTDDERQRRAVLLQRADMVRMALASARARSKRTSSETSGE